MLKACMRFFGKNILAPQLCFGGGGQGTDGMKHKLEYEVKFFGLLTAGNAEVRFVLPRKGAWMVSWAG